MACKPIYAENKRKTINHKMKTMPMKQYRIFFIFSIAMILLFQSLSVFSAGKVKGVWVDAHSNLSRFMTKADVDHYVAKLKSAGFNTIYLDVKPLCGKTLYKSKILPPLTHFRGKDFTKDWDYLSYWIKAARKKDIDVFACVATLGFGSPSVREGVVYEDSRWDGKTQMKMLNNNPDSLFDVRDEKGADAAFLNPAIPEVQAFVVSYITELVKRYPKLKGICLDYCRWWHRDYAMSPATLQLFADYIGQPVGSRNDILTSDGGRGKLYSQWIEFRSMSVKNLISQIRSTVKATNPRMQLHLWAGTDWECRYEYGQNWASPNFIPQDPLYTPNYNKTAYAHLLDAFIIGVYSEYALTEEYPGTIWWAVEAAMDRYRNYIMGACPVYGSVQAYSDYKQTKSDGLPEACYQCLSKSDGLMVFELGHLENRGLWNQVKKGIERAEKRK